MTSANARQVGGNHYGPGGSVGIQHWDLIYNVLPTGFHGYFLGQISKYTGRSRKKNGLQDVQKARHFAEKYKELLSGPPPKAYTMSFAELLDYVTQYARDNQLTPIELRITTALLTRPIEDMRNGLLDAVISDLLSMEAGAGVSTTAWGVKW